MLEGPIASSMLLYIVPIVLASFLSALYSTADMSVLGHFGSAESVAAIGASGAVTSFLITISTAFSLGTNVLLARAIGSKKRDEMQKTVGTSFVFSILIGVFMTALAEIFAYPFLRLTDCPENIMDLAALYMRFFAAVMPASFFYSFMSNVLRLNGDTLRPFAYATVGGVVNVALNLFFVIVCDMDLVGVALATVIGSYLQSGLLFVRLMRLDGPCRLNIKNICFDFGILHRMVKLGGPSSISCIASSLSSIYMQIIVNGNGDIGTAGNTAASNLENYMFGVFGALGAAIAAYMGQNIGADNRLRVRRSFLVGTGIMCSFAGALMAAAHLFGREILSAIYLPNAPEAVAFGGVRVSLILGTAVLCALTYSISHAMQSFGLTFFQSVVDIALVCGLRALWLAVVYRIYPTPAILYAAFPVSWVAVILVSGGYLLLSFHRYMRGRNYNV